MNKSANLAVEIKKRVDVTYEPLAPVQLAKLRAWLLKIANVEYDKYLETDPEFLEEGTSSLDAKAVGLNQIAKEEEHQVRRQDALEALIANGDLGTGPGRP